MSRWLVLPIRFATIIEEKGVAFVHYNRSYASDSALADHLFR